MTLTSNVLINSLTWRLCMLPKQETFINNVVYRCAIFFKLPYDDVKFIGRFTFSEVKASKILTASSPTVVKSIASLVASGFLSAPIARRNQLNFLSKDVHSSSRLELSKRSGAGGRNDSMLHVMYYSTRINITFNSTALHTMSTAPCNIPFYMSLLKK